MAKIIITSEGKQISEVELVKERVTIGRKPYNDIVLEHRAVSGQHATITLMLEDAILEDLGSTNGTLFAGKNVFRQKLSDGDSFNIAIFEMKYVASPPKPQPTGKIEVMNGVHTGKRLALNKPLTTIGKPGEAVVAITYAGGSYTAAAIDGELGPSINGAALESAPRRLVHGDVLDLAGTRMTFLAK
ncbi:MAG: FHA domain-containing protein [Telluria sp.]|nr:FHA domain-containing protein [Telluria sp.]